MSTQLSWSSGLSALIRWWRRMSGLQARPQQATAIGDPRRSTVEFWGTGVQWGWDAAIFWPTGAAIRRHDCGHVAGWPPPSVTPTAISSRTSIAASWFGVVDAAVTAISAGRMAASGWGVVAFNGPRRIACHRRCMHTNRRRGTKSQRRWGRLCRGVSRSLKTSSYTAAHR